MSKDTVQPVMQFIEEGHYRTLYPIYAADSDGEGLLVTAGGGGGKQHGVFNYLQCHVVSDSSHILTVSTLSTGDDTVTSVSYSRSLRLWSATLKAEVLLFRISESSLFEIQPVLRFAAEGSQFCRISCLGSRNSEKLIVTGGDNGQGRLWSWNGKEAPQQLLSVIAGIEGNKDNDVVSVDLSQDGLSFLTLTRSGFTKVWRTDDGTCSYSVTGPQQGISARYATFLPVSLSGDSVSDKSILVAYYQARKPSLVAIYDIASRKETIVTLKSNSVISCVSHVLDNGVFFLGFATGNGEMWRISKRGSWNIRRAQSVKAAQIHDLPISAVATLSNGSFVSGSPDFNLLLWKASDSIILSRLLKTVIAAILLLILLFVAYPQALKY